MPTYRATALVLRKTKLGEADTIVTMLGSQGRQIRAVAKGVRRTRSKIGARLEPFAQVDLVLHRGRNLDIVTEVSTVASNTSLRDDFDRTVAASVVADVLDKATADADTEPVLYELALATFGALEAASGPTHPWLVAAFLLKALSLLGLRPTIGSCARCGCATQADGGGRGPAMLAFSAEHGGTLCVACADSDPAAAPITENARNALRVLMRARMTEIADADLAPAVRDEVLRQLTAFTRHHIPARLRSLEFMWEQMRAGTWPSVDPPVGVG